MEAPVSSSLGAMGSLLKKLDVLLAPGCKLPKWVKDRMQLLKGDLEEVSTYLEDLSEVDDPPLTAKCWMKEVRELSYDMDDYIHKSVRPFRGHTKTVFVCKIKHPKIIRLPKRLMWHQQLVKMVSEFRIYVQDAIERHMRYELDCSTKGSRFLDYVSLGPMLPTPYEETANLVIDGRTNEFINSLDKDGDRPLKVVSIVGSGGIGKTTLAKMVYSKLGVKFDCRAFIRVSQKPRMKSLLRDMLSQLQQNQPPDDWMDLDLIDNIRKHLQDKRYLIIIDDLRTTSAWDIINQAFPECNQQSRIIATTQIENVALTCCCHHSKYIFEMKPLDDDHSRKLFFDRLFLSPSDCTQQLEEITNKIVQICGGLPLAIINIASLLASQPVIVMKLWTCIFDSLSSDLRTNSTLEGVRGVLSLSYNILPRYLKTCLLYLNMYPEGYTISKDDLVKKWVAEGFVDTIEGRDMEKVAGSYLDELISRGFIQPIGIKYNDEVSSCTVHDMVRDLIANKSEEENFILALDSFRKNVRLSDKVRRLSLHFGDAKYAKTPANISTSQIRSLTYFGLFKCMPNIAEFKLLRVLNLLLSGLNGNDPLDLTGISELFQLRYLKIASDICIYLPNQMRRLQYLETFDMDTKLTAIPWDIIHLPCLSHLYLPFDTNLMDWIGHMTPASILECLDPSSSNPDDLQDIDTSSSIVPSKHLERNMEALGSLFGALGYLKTLALVPVSDQKSSMLSSISEVTISWDGLAPPRFLQRFEWLLHSCIFSRIPSWIAELHNLCILKIAVREFRLNGVDILKGLPALTTLYLNVHTTPVETLVFGKVGFSVLKYFKFRCSSIPWLKFESNAMPDLRKLKLCFTDLEVGLHGPARISIEQLPGLKEISAEIRGACADAEFAFIWNHPSNPGINGQLVNHRKPEEEIEIVDFDSDEYYEAEDGDSSKDENTEDGSTITKGEKDEFLEENIDESKQTSFIRGILLRWPSFVWTVFWTFTRRLMLQLVSQRISAPPASPWDLPFPEPMTVESKTKNVMKDAITAEPTTVKSKPTKIMVDAITAEPMEFVRYLSKLKIDKTKPKLTVDAITAEPMKVTSKAENVNEDAIVSAFTGAMNSLRQKLGTFTKLTHMGNDVMILKDELGPMNALLEQLADMSEPDMQIKLWMNRMRDVIYDIEDYIDYLMAQLDRDNNAKAIDNLWGEDTVRKFTEKIQELTRNAREANIPSMAEKVEACTSRTSLQPTVCYDDPVRLVGIDGPRHELVKHVMGSGQQLQVVCILGPAGIGKTTLARQVYNRVQHRFDRRYFITVPRNKKIGIDRLLQDILFEINGGCDYLEYTLQGFVEKIKKRLKNDRYLIVLDGVWSTETWVVIRSALPESNDGSRIIITTHIGEVAESSGKHFPSSFIFRMDPLALQDSLILFKSTIFGSKGRCPTELQKVAHKILEGCGGLPVAINLIAGLLCIKPAIMEQWALVAKHMEPTRKGDLTIEGMRNVFHIIYSDLPRDMKSCLLYMSAFPENHVIRKDRLIWRWMAEGLIPTRSTESLWETGERYFEELMSRKLIEPAYDEKTYDMQSIEPTGCKVQCLVLEFITTLSNEHNFVTRHPEANGTQHDVIRRLTISHGSQARGGAFKSNTVDLSNVRSLTILEGGISAMKASLQNFNILQLKFLRVLDLEVAHDLGIDHLEGIAALVLLRYLRIGSEDIYTLPEEIGQLEHLETLDLRGANSLKSLPASIVRLRKLVRLLYQGVYESTYIHLPRNLWKLPQLEEVSTIHIGSLMTVEELLRKSERLRRLGMKWSSDGPTSSTSFFEIVERSNFESLMMDCAKLNDSCINMLLGSSKALNRRLQRFEMKISARRLPHQLASLVSLTHLRVSLGGKLNEEVLRVLGGLHNLIHLHFHSRPPAKGVRLTVSNDGFPRLTLFSLRYWTCATGLWFGPEAMPLLRTLLFNFNSKEMHGDFDFGIQHLSSLTRVNATITCSNEEVEAKAEAAFRGQVLKNPNNPILDLTFRQYT